MLAHKQMGDKWTCDSYRVPAYFSRPNKTFWVCMTNCFFVLTLKFRTYYPTPVVYFHLAPHLIYYVVWKRFLKSVRRRLPGNQRSTTIKTNSKILFEISGQCNAVNVKMSWTYHICNCSVHLPYWWGIGRERCIQWRMFVSSGDQINTNIIKNECIKFSSALTYFFSNNTLPNAVY